MEQNTYNYGHNMSKNYKIILKRFDDYNSTKIVGFEIILTDNRQSKYFEEILSLSDCVDKSVNDICHLAYKKLKKSIKLFVESENSKEYIPIGGEFIPPEEPVEEEIVKEPVEEETVEEPSQK